MIALPILGACWMLFHPWQGLYHDGVLYAAQALFRRMPEILGQDPFFSGPSQAGYSVFAWIHGFAIEALGLASASHLLWVLAQTIWVLAVWGWAGATLPPSDRLVGAAMLAGCQASYGSDGLLSVAESFLTARSLAETLVVGALLLTLQRRRSAGWLLMALAFTIHPLMAMPGAVAAVACAHWSLIRRHATTIGLGILTTLVITAFAIQGELLNRIDPEWRSLILRRSPLVDVGSWGISDWSRTFFPIAVVLAASREVRPRWSRVWQGIAACATLGLLLAAFASVTDWELGLQAQFWRWTWLSAWAAPLAAVMAVTSRHQTNRAARIAFLGTLPALALGMQDWMPLGWALQWLSLLGLLHASARARTRGPDTVHVTFAISVAVALFAIVSAVLVQVAMARYADNSDVAAASPWALGAAHTGWLIAPLIALLAKGAFPENARSARYRAIGMCSVAALVFSVSLAIEGRGRRAIAYEALASEGLSHWRSAIPRNASVFWPERMPAIWFGLERRSHASFIQLAGIVFNRSSMIVANRLERTAALSGAELPIDFRERNKASDRMKPTERDLIDACSDRDLDFVVLDTRFERFSPHPHIEHVDRRDFHLHACARVRAVSAQDAPAS